MRQHINTKGKIYDLVVPICVLIIFCILSMLYVGGYWSEEGSTLFDAFGNTDAGTALSLGALASLIFAFIYFMCRRVLSFRDFFDCIGPGVKSMVPACYTGRFCLWRSYFSDFRYNNSGFYRCTVQPPEARCHTGAICSNCSRMLSGRLHNRRTDRKNGIWYQYSNHIRSLFSAAVCSIEHFAKVIRKEEISVRLIRY